MTASLTASIPLTSSGSVRPQASSLRPQARALSLPALTPPSPANVSIGTEPGLLTNNPLLHVKARVQVCVGEAIISVGDLLSATLDQVIPLAQALDAPVDLMLEGQVIARGQLIAVDQHFGLRITELSVPLAL